MKPDRVEYNNQECRGNGQLGHLKCEGGGGRAELVSNMLEAKGGDKR